MHTWVDDTPLEETLSALDHAVTSGRASYVGVSNYSGWQTAQAATWQRAVPGRAVLASTQVEYSLLNRARRARGRSRPRPRSAWACSPGRRSGRGVLTGKYRTGTPSDSRAASPHFANFVDTYLGERSRAHRRGGRPRRRRPRLVVPRGGARLGARPSRRHRPDRRRPHRRPAQGALGVEELTLPDEIVEALDDVSGE